MNLVCLKLSVSLTIQAIVELDYQLPSYMYGISILIVYDPKVQHLQAICISGR